MELNLRMIYAAIPLSLIFFRKVLKNKLFLNKNQSLINKLLVEVELTSLQLSNQPNKQMINKKVQLILSNIRLAFKIGPETYLS